ncbi:hypothetical protein HDV02_001002 [Globomyces sp. JEL0801]|nr:hypothetical protein HDV02_001002 [Globomyces sp. JEL0801]
MIRTRDFQAELIDFNRMENKDTNELDEEHRTDVPYHDLNQDSIPIRNQPELNLLNKLQNQIQIHKENPSDRIESPAYFKIRTTLDIEYHGSSMSKLILNHSNDTTPITTNDVIITITFLKFNTKISNQKTSQFKFLANTPLTMIRDTFFCISDFIHLNDLPTLRNTIAKRTSPSFIYINNTFYVDDRDMVHDEYMDILKGWWERVAYDQPFLIQSMEILLLDIDWQLNTKYLLHHQGDCGHVFVVDEIRYEASL